MTKSNKNYKMRVPTNQGCLFSGTTKTCGTPISHKGLVSNCTPSNYINIHPYSRGGGAWGIGGGGTYIHTIRKRGMGYWGGEAGLNTYINKYIYIYLLCGSVS